MCATNLLDTAVEAFPGPSAARLHCKGGEDLLKSVRAADLLRFQRRERRGHIILEELLL